MVFNETVSLCALIQSKSLQRIRSSCSSHLWPWPCWI